MTIFGVDAVFFLSVFNFIVFGIIFSIHFLILFVNDVVVNCVP
jgi:hypothetical protein